MHNVQVQTVYAARNVAAANFFFFFKAQLIKAGSSLANIFYSRCYFDCLSNKKNVFEAESAFFRSIALSLFLSSGTFICFMYAQFALLLLSLLFPECT